MQDIFMELKTQYTTYLAHRRGLLLASVAVLLGHDEVLILSLSQQNEARQLVSCRRIGTPPSGFQPSPARTTSIATDSPKQFPMSGRVRRAAPDPRREAVARGEQVRTRLSSWTLPPAASRAGPAAARQALPSEIISENQS